MFFDVERLGNYKMLTQFKNKIYEQLGEVISLEIDVMSEEWLEIKGMGVDDKRVKFMIRIGVSNTHESVGITNIIVKDEISNKGIGKKIIHEIYKIAKENGYRLLMIELVPSFYERLLKRGAEKTDQYDVLEITENTRLID